MSGKHMNKKYNRRKPKGNILSVMTAFLLIAVCWVGFGSVITSAKDSDAAVCDTQIIYNSITIHEDDTLWSIAEQYKPESYSIDRYIKELKELNHLQNNQIYAGDKLIIICDALTNIDPDGIQIVCR